jgi:hypothetical protein
LIVENKSWASWRGFKALFEGYKIKKIISGGQTGADRRGLDFAIEHGIPHAGWCPKGRLAEDGKIDHRYCLQETSTASYPQRTEKNVLVSDGTVVFTIAPNLTGGSKRTESLAKKHGKPFIHLHSQMYNYPQRLLSFITENRDQTELRLPPYLVNLVYLLCT